MLNRSAACQAAVMHPRILEVIEPLLGDDCHVIANTAWRNPPEFPGGSVALRRRPARAAARGRAVGRPHPVSGVRDRRAHLSAGLRARRRADRGRARESPVGPARPVRPDARRGPLLRRSPAGAASTVAAGDVALFVSDAWHRGLPAGPGGRGRYFLQVHYGRRDIAQRIRTTDVVNQLSARSDRARRRPTARAPSSVCTHPFFYDA